MIRTVLIDDEDKAREILKEILLLIEPEIEILGEYNNIKDGKEGILEHQPDLVFLDVDMPNGSGFDLLEQFNHVDFDIIFATGHNQYAIQAIKASAFDFILKPIEISELKRSIERYKKKLAADLTQASKFDQIELLIQRMRHQNEPVKRISIPSGNGVMFIDTENIVRFEANGNYTYIYMDNGKKLTASKSLKEYEESLNPSQFLRVHQSHLVNKMHITKYVKTEGYYVVMSDNSTVDISRRRKNMIEKELL